MAATTTPEADRRIAPKAGPLVAHAQAVLTSGRLGEARQLFGEAAAAAEAEGDRLAFADAALGCAGIWLNEHRSMAEADHVVVLQRRALAQLVSSEHSRRFRLEARLAAEEAYRNGTDAPVAELMRKLIATIAPAVVLAGVGLATHAATSDAPANACSLSVVCIHPYIEQDNLN